MNQKELKRINATHNQKQSFTVNFSLPCPQSGRFLTIPLLTEEALFTWAFRNLVSLLKYLQELKVAYQ